MYPPVAAIAKAHRVLQKLLVELDDKQVVEPSALPGWSRGHVLAHLTDNARMFARVADHALRGELVESYDGGADERNAIIEATAGRTAEEHRAALAEQTAELEAVWARTAEQDWNRPVLFRSADIAATAFARWREVWIHMVDLDLGIRPDDWPMELACHAVDFLAPRMPSGVRVQAEDVQRQWSSAGEEKTLVTGGVRDLAAWLAGRVPTTPPTAPGRLPELGPWPPHPPSSASGNKLN